MALMTYTHFSTPSPSCPIPFPNCLKSNTRGLHDQGDKAQGAKSLQGQGLFIVLHSVRRLCTSYFLIYRFLSFSGNLPLFGLRNRKLESRSRGCSCILIHPLTPPTPSTGLNQGCSYIAISAGGGGGGGGGGVGVGSCKKKFLGHTHFNLWC